jgi:hypothetical protein
MDPGSAAHHLVLRYVRGTAQNIGRLRGHDAYPFLILK